MKTAGILVFLSSHFVKSSFLSFEAVEFGQIFFLLNSTHIYYSKSDFLYGFPIFDDTGDGIISFVVAKAVFSPTNCAAASS